MAMDGPLSICMVSDDAKPAATGVGTHIQLLTRELARRGHRVSVLTTRRKGEPQLEIWEGVRLHRTFTLDRHVQVAPISSNRFNLVLLIRNAAV